VRICAVCGHPSETEAKFCSECGSPLAAAPSAREQRKTVTVLFCDVVGSTALGESTDPEALRAVLARYFERMSGIVERHGGTVEKFIGDAVMAVFGVPVLHEDDALRACRAAVEMREALPELGLGGRIGLDTGEVVTGTGERLATGDAVNVASRLQHAAEPGEILIGAETWRVVRDSAQVGAVRALDLKGKADPVTAYPLEDVLSHSSTVRRLDGPLIGRERERRVLSDAWQRARSEPSCHLFTLLGAAGVGKSRLTAEFLSGIRDALVVRGRCLSYGEGITYWPVVEIVLQLGRRPTDPRAAEVIASLLGETDDAVSAAEIAWAFRRLLEESAPVVCVFDDLHWAEPTLLDLIEHLADLSRDAPILALCMARPELLDRRSTWAGGKVNATTVLLEPLSESETDELIEHLLGATALEPRFRARIRAAAEGNPLFVEEMLAMVGESPGAEISVPPTIQALLAARLDQLDQPERNVLECAAVEGNVFHRGGVQALAPAEGDVPGRLMTLVRKELVRPDRAQLVGDDAFRFRHLLIRDAAYDGLPKATRAELHERFADWLADNASQLVEFDEISGYHLDQAYRFRVELGLADERTAILGARAADRLGAAGERALVRGDVAAAIVLLERAVALAPDDPQSLGRELKLIDAKHTAGALGEALAAADDLIARSEAARDDYAELRARLARSEVAFMAEAATEAEVQPLIERAMTFFGDRHDDAGLAQAWFAVAWIEHNACRWRARHAALEHVLRHARITGNQAQVQKALLWIAAGYVFGPFPVDEGTAWFEAHAAISASNPMGLGMAARLEAMRGEIGRARELIDEARKRTLELGQELLSAATSLGATEVELEIDDFERAAESALRGCAELQRFGERGWLSTGAAEAALALHGLARDDEAWHWTTVADEAGATDDVITQVLIRRARALILARRRDPGAEALAREALALIDSTDMLNAQAEARITLATVLFEVGRGEEAAGLYEAAEALFAEKGNLSGIARARAAAAAVTA
jgi:class 3 adenylate cyclase/tetratricopeptide (TPR) repeat protein